MKLNTKNLNIEIQLLDSELYGEEGPEYATKGSIGVDLKLIKDIVLLPNSTQLVGTGLALNIVDKSVGAFVYPRSGLGHKQGVVLGNLTGVIDSDYQGEIMLSLWNRSEEVRYLSRGDRVAQLVFVPILKPKLEIVSWFEVSDRGAQGFGSTGS